MTQSNPLAYATRLRAQQAVDACRAQVNVAAAAAARVHLFRSFVGPFARLANFSPCRGTVIDRFNDIMIKYELCSVASASLLYAHTKSQIKDDEYPTKSEKLMRTSSEWM